MIMPAMARVAVVVLRSDRLSYIAAILPETLPAMAERFFSMLAA